MTHLHRLRIAVPLVALLLLVACAPKHPELSPEGQRNYTLLQVAKYVNDASETVIAANKLGQLSDRVTATVLTVNKQVLDYVQANPRTTRAQVLVVIRNARDGLPPDLAMDVSDYLSQLIAFLMEAS